MAEETKVEGLRELERVLVDRAPREVSKALRGATRKAADTFKRAASASAPVGKTGALARGIKVVTRVRSLGARGAAFRAVVGLVKDVFYGRFLEFGTVYIAARPFMRPAFEQNTQQAISTFVSALRGAVAKLTKR